jgi:hypothetical protein
MTQDCERITVTLIPKAAAALAAVSGTGRTRTDAVNRALQAYAFLEEQVAAGGEVLVRLPDGTVRQVMFL